MAANKCIKKQQMPKDHDALELNRIEKMLAINIILTADYLTTVDPGWCTFWRAHCI